jgi:hypothetical protein
VSLIMFGKTIYHIIVHRHGSKIEWKKAVHLPLEL